MAINNAREAAHSIEKPTCFFARFPGICCPCERRDIFSIDEGHYAIVIGDVSGKGLKAASQLSPIRNMLRSLLYEHRNAARAVTRLNSIVNANNLITGFVTVFVGIYGAQSGKDRYASCGHEPVMIRRQASQEVELLQGGGLPLGVNASAMFDERMLQLDAGDILLLYTDGVTEAGPTRFELLGHAGLSCLLCRLEFGDDLAAAAERLVNHASNHARVGFRDDVCVLMAKRH
jgi:serine phosphatase RsbU (regulator of sigma subunit)